MRQTVSLSTQLWNARITPNIFFRKMPYILKHFNFVTMGSPEYILFSKKSRKKFPGNCTRIFYTGEDLKPPMGSCDWAFSFCYDQELKNPRHFRLPNYARLGAGKDLIKPQSYDPEEILKSKTKFCAFVYWNNVTVRNKFFDQLSEYKKVDAPGRARNNMISIEKAAKVVPFGRRFAKGFYRSYDLKLNFLRPYKFVVAFENTSSPGYTTEKIYHAMLANSIPLYWGNRLVHRDFNKQSFLNLHDYGSIKNLVDRIKELDQDDKLYMDYLAQPWYPNNKLTTYVTPGRILNQFKKIFRRKS